MAAHHFSSVRAPLLSCLWQHPCLYSSMFVSCLFERRSIITPLWFGASLHICYIPYNTVAVLPPSVMLGTKECDAIFLLSRGKGPWRGLARISGSKLTLPTCYKGKWIWYIYISMKRRFKRHHGPDNFTLCIDVMKGIPHSNPSPMSLVIFRHSHHVYFINRTSIKRRFITCYKGKWIG